MGRLNDIKKHFRGRQAWRSANLFMVFFFYTLVIVIMIVNPSYMWMLGIFLVVFVPSYAYIYEHKKYTILENSSKIRCVEGFTTFAHKKAEEHFFDVIGFEVKEQLTAIVLDDTQDYIDRQNEYTKFLKTRTGLEGFKQLSYKETDNESDNKQKLKSDQIEKDNYNKSQEEYKIMTDKKSMKTTNKMEGDTNN